jgi:hypothetical protein
MKKTTAVGLLILSGLGLVTYGIINYFKQQASLLKEFTWKITSFQLDTVTLQEVKGSITIRFSSISNLEFIIEQFILDVYINGQKAGYVNEITQVLIPANGYSDIPIAFTIDPQYLFTDASDILAYTLKQKDAIITLNGYASVKSGFISATVPIKCNCSVQNLSCDCS